jgi:hypothetical protein
MPPLDGNSHYLLTGRKGVQVTRLVDCCCPWRQEAGGQRSLLLKLSVERRCPVSYGILIQLAARVIDRLAYRAPLLMGFKAGIASLAAAWCSRFLFDRPVGIGSSLPNAIVEDMQKDQPAGTRTARASAAIRSMRLRRRPRICARSPTRAKALQRPQSSRAWCSQSSWRSPGLSSCWRSSSRISPEAVRLAPTSGTGSGRFRA